MPSGSRVLAAVLKKEGADLIFCSTESTDGYTGMVPGGIAEFLCIPQTLLNAPQLSNSQAQLDFALTAGLPIGFTLQQADVPNSSWVVNSNAVLSTNMEGKFYRFTAPAQNSKKFYRLRWP